MGGYLKQDQSNFNEPKWEYKIGSSFKVEKPGMSIATFFWNKRAFTFDFC